MSARASTPATTYTPDAQARFPEPELRELADYFAGQAQWWRRNSRGGADSPASLRNEERAALILRAIDAHDALRDRCLQSEMRRPLPSPAGSGDAHEQ